MTRRNGGARPNSGGKREGAGRPALGHARGWIRLPRDVIEAATQRALELSADSCRKVSRQEVYRLVIAGELEPLHVVGTGPARKDRLDLTPAAAERLGSAVEVHGVSMQRAAEILLCYEDL